MFNNGRRNKVDDFREHYFTSCGKIFEIAFYGRLYFINEAFDNVDRYYGGFDLVNWCILPHR